MKYLPIYTHANNNGIFVEFRDETGKVEKRFNLLSVDGEEIMDAEDQEDWEALSTEDKAKVIDDCLKKFAETFNVPIMRNN